jgi:hypothetical protein
MRVWNRLLCPGYADEFAALFQKYAIRFARQHLALREANVAYEALDIGL